MTLNFNHRDTNTRFSDYLENGRFDAYTGSPIINGAETRSRYIHTDSNGVVWEIWLEGTGLASGGDVETVRFFVNGTQTLSINSTTGSIDTIANFEAALNTVFTTGNLADLYLLFVNDAHNHSGGIGRDMAFGSNFSDDIRMGTGGDDIFGSLGDDWIRGESGEDTVIYASRALPGVSVEARLDIGRTNFSNGDMDRLFDIENLVGTDLDDFLRGDGGDNALSGASGDDTIRGGGGNDFIVGGNGSDLLKGEAGDDTIMVSGDDSVPSGAPYTDYVYGGDGDDRIFGHDSSIAIVYAGAGADFFEGFSQDDRFFGGDGADNAMGYDGEDVLLGEGGDDWLYGKGGDDRIEGGSGDDFMEGGEGSDTYTGGEGVDTFILQFFDDGIDDRDVITDFELGVDRILIDFSEVSIKEIRSAANPANTIVDFDSGDQLVIQGVAAWEITESDFAMI